MTYCGIDLGDVTVVRITQTPVCDDAGDILGVETRIELDTDEDAP